MVWTAAQGEDRLWAQSITRPLWCDDQRVARIVKNDLALASGPCWSQNTMLITGNYTADHREIQYWWWRNTMLITGKYSGPYWSERNMVRQQFQPKAASFWSTRPIRWSNHRIRLPYWSPRWWWWPSSMTNDDEEEEAIICLITILIATMMMMTIIND